MAVVIGVVVIIAIAMLILRKLFFKFMSTPFSLPFTKEGRESMSDFIPSPSGALLLLIWFLGECVPMIVIPAVLGGLLYVFGTTALLIVVALLSFIIYFWLVRKCMFPWIKHKSWEELYKKRFRHNLPLFITNFISGIFVFSIISFLMYHFDYKPNIVQPSLYVFFICLTLFGLYPLLFIDSYRKDFDQRNWSAWPIIIVVLRNFILCCILMLIVLYCCLCMAPAVYVYNGCVESCAPYIWIGQALGLMVGFMVALITFVLSPIWLPFYWFETATAVFIEFWIFCTIALVIKYKYKL